MKTITVLLADDHKIVCEGYRHLLGVVKDIRVIGEAHDGREAVNMAKLHRPDVIVMDLSMPLLNGLEATRQILADQSQAKVIILSGHNDDEHINRVVDAGAAGYLFKQSSAQSLTQAIREVHAGNKFFSPAIIKRLEGRFKRGDKTGVWQLRNSLTPREMEVIQLIAESHANKMIAAVLGISIKTVEKHRQQLMNKLNIHDAAGLTRYAISEGIIEAPNRVAIV
jgi:DNA-binding NarL/FixJ family response regulator